MKKNLLATLLSILFICPQGLLAQLPETSTADNPLWYYIQVLGDDSSREDRVFVAKGNYVYGEDLNTNSEAQLFRFEKSGNQYYIISKSANKKVDVAINSGEEALSLSDAGIGFTLDVLGDYYNITATKTPTGGDSGKKWAHQANNNSSYKIILVNTSWSSADNSKFCFVPYESINLEYSTTGDETWYRLSNAKAGYEGLVLTQTNSENTPFELLPEVAGDASQYWKLEKSGALVHLINKASGSIIQTKSSVLEDTPMFNFIQATQTLSESNGWTLTHRREGQYIISGIEDDNIKRYLNAANVTKAPDTYDSSALLNSGFAWKFNYVGKGGEVNIPSVEKDEFIVYTENRRIVVVNAENYTVRTLQGVLVDGNNELPVGIYLVTGNGVTKKVLVN